MGERLATTAEIVAAEARADRRQTPRHKRDSEVERHLDAKIVQARNAAASPGSSAVDGRCGYK